MEPLEDRLVPASFRFEMAAYAVGESASSATVVVQRTSTEGAASVDISTWNGSATAGSDFDFTNQTLQFADGIASVDVPVSILGDALAEGNEDFTMLLANPSAGYDLDANLSQTQVTIADDDHAPIANPDTYHVAHDQTLEVAAAQGLLANDSDADNDALTVSEINGSAAAVGQPTTLLSGASVTVHAVGSFTYTPVSNSPYTDSFFYTVSDGTNPVTTTATIVVMPNATELYASYLSSVAEADDTYETAVLAAIDARDTAIAQVRADAQADADTEFADYQNSLTQAKADYDAAFDEAETTYDEATADAVTAWKSATASALAAYNAALVDAETAFDEAVALLESQYETAIAEADAAYENTVAPYQEVRDDAYEAWQADPENETLEQAYLDAQAALDAAIVAADEQRVDDYTDAAAAYDAGLADADADLVAVNDPAYADLQAAVATPDAEYAAVNGPAWAAFLADVTDADATYLTEEEPAWAAYLDAIAVIESDLAAAEAGILASFDDALAAALADWESDESDAWTTYASAMALLPGSPPLDDRIAEPTPVDDAGVSDAPEMPQERPQLRAMPFRVSSSADSGEFTLRRGIESAVANRPLSIRFTLDGIAVQMGPIHLRSQLEIAADRIISINDPDEGVMPVQRTIRRTSTEAFRILRVAPGASVTINQLTLRNGFAPGASPENYGGAIRNNGHLTLNNARVWGNRAANYAGGIYNAAGATTIIDGGELYSNRTPGEGGAIYNDASLTNTTVGVVRIRNGTHIEHNWAYNGGAIYNHSASTQQLDRRATLSISNGVQISNNHAIGAESGGRGGAIYNLGVVSISSNSYLGYNTSIREGGAIFTTYPQGTTFLSLVVLERTIIEFNQSIAGPQSKGGAIYVRGGTVRLLFANILRDNSARLGPGIARATGQGTNTTVILNVDLNDIPVGQRTVDDPNP